MSIRFFIKILLNAILLFVCIQPGLAQQPVLIRSTFSSGTVTDNISITGKKYYSLQCIGQSSVIGSYSKNKIVLRQGFLQPGGFPGIRSEPVRIKADIYPNPFLNSFSITFGEEIKNNLTVTLYNINGVITYSGIFAPSQEITLNPEAIPSGLYIIDVLNGQQRYTSRVIRK